MFACGPAHVYTLICLLLACLQDQQMRSANKPSSSVQLTANSKIQIANFFVNCNLRKYLQGISLGPN